MFGNYYGTGAADTEAVLAHGEDVVLVIDVQGARQVRSRGIETRRHLRAAALGRDPGAAAARPQQGQRRADSRSGSRSARREVGEFAQYEYVVVNDELEAAVERLRAIVLAERRAAVQARCAAPTASNADHRASLPTSVGRSVRLQPD